MGPRRQKQPQQQQQQTGHDAGQAQHVQHQAHLPQYSFHPEVDPNLQAQLVPPPKRTEAELNVSVLQRYNPEVCALEHVAPYAVVYEFSSEKNSWDKSEIEGSVFICKLWGNQESDERYNIMVLNRRKLTNLDYELKDEGEVEFTDQYIILADSGNEEGQKIWGLWVFAEPEPSSTATQPREVADKVRNCLKLAEQGRRIKAQQQIASPSSALPGRHINVQDLFRATSG